MERKRCHVDTTGDGCENIRRSSCDGTLIQHEDVNQEKRVRREIANSNERRRMQSINAGFDSLRVLLPPAQYGDKISKATILQLTAEYINNLVNRVNILEHEVALYRQTTGIPPSTVIPEFPTTLNTSKKRKSDDQRKRVGSTRSRRRRLETSTISDTTRTDLVHFSPTSTETRQTSPSNSFMSCTSASPSPFHDGTSSTTARLEHLVMAIEQIEGGRALTTSCCESQTGSLSPGLHSSPLSTETYWHNPSENYQACLYPTQQDSTLKPVTSFADVIMLTPVSADMVPAPTSLHGPEVCTKETTDYPVVSKLLNRPIPHKYLHRPQVVVNSSH